MAKPRLFQYTLLDLAEVSGLTYDVVKQHRRRGLLDPACLSSVVVWLAKHGSEEARLRILTALAASPSKAAAKRREALKD
jgi:hypothetical protein